MASPWIKMRVDLFADPRVSRLASRWERDICHADVRLCVAVGMLHRTWSLFDAQTADGELPFCDLAWLDAQVGCDGWGQALVDIGWLVVSPDGLTVPDFEEHNGASAKKRAQATKRQRKSRQTSRTERDRCHTDERDKSVTPSSSSSLSTSTPVGGRGGVGEKGGQPNLDKALAEHLDELPAGVPTALKTWAEYRLELVGRASGVTYWREQIREAVQDPLAYAERVQFSISKESKSVLSPGPDELAKWRGEHGTLVAYGEVGVPVADISRMGYGFQNMLAKDIQAARREEELQALREKDARGEIGKRVLDVHGRPRLPQGGGA